MQTVIMRHLRTVRQHLQVLSQSPALQSPTRYIAQRREALVLMRTRLISAQQRTVSLKHRNFISLTAKLDAMSPLKVLTRGYAMAQNEDGTVVRSVQQAKVGDPLIISVSDGAITTTVTDIKENAI